MKPLSQETYVTPPSQTSIFRKLGISPSLIFYSLFLRIVWRNGREAKHGHYGYEEWAQGSLDVMRALERSGVVVEITGMQNIGSCQGPVVFISNHMSTLETMVLPCIVQPLKTVTFVVKESLIEMPVFKYVMRSRNPVTVGRTNPREDLKKVLEEGTERIKSGIGIIIFPQSTRSAEFREDEFNSLGIKLALRAGVPVVPVALKTDAWGNGRHIKEFGPIDIRKKVHFAFGPPLTLTGRGTSEHEKVIAFIKDHLAQWQQE